MVQAYTIWNDQMTQVYGYLWYNPNHGKRPWKAQHAFWGYVSYFTTREEAEAYVKKQH